MALSKSAKYYRDNPEARKKKAAYDKKLNARPEQRKKRSELTTRNRKADERGVDRTGKDYNHGTGRYETVKKNRGAKTGTKGDRNARGGGKK